MANDGRVKMATLAQIVVGLMTADYQGISSGNVQCAIAIVASAWRKAIGQVVVQRARRSGKPRGIAESKGGEDGASV